MENSNKRSDEYNPLCQDNKTGELQLNIGDKRQLIHTSPCSSTPSTHPLATTHGSPKESFVANLLNDNDIMPQEYHDRDKEQQMEVKEDEGTPYIPEVVEHHDEPEPIANDINNHVVGGLFSPPPIHLEQYHPHIEHISGEHHGPHGPPPINELEYNHPQNEHHEIVEDSHHDNTHDDADEGLYDLPPIHELESHHDEHFDDHHGDYGHHGDYVHEATTHPEKGKSFVQFLHYYRKLTNRKINAVGLYPR